MVVVNSLYCIALLQSDVKAGEAASEDDSVRLRVQSELAEGSCVVTGSQRHGVLTTGIMVRLSANFLTPERLQAASLPYSISLEEAKRKVRVLVVLTSVAECNSYISRGNVLGGRVVVVVGFVN